MTDALTDHEGIVSRTIIHLRFGDDNSGLAGEVEELAKLVEHLNKASTAYSMEISAEKTKLMTNTTRSTNKENNVKDRSLRLSQASSTWAQLYLTRVPSLIYSPG